MVNGKLNEVGSYKIPWNFAAGLQELLEVNGKFSARLQKGLEESVAKGDEVLLKFNLSMNYWRLSYLLLDKNFNCDESKT